MNERLLSILRQLRLSGLAETLDVRLQEAAGHQLSHAEFLELILQDELMVRQERQIDRRVKAALFRELKPLDRLRLVVQSVDPQEADLRPGHLPLHPRGAGRAVAGPARRGQIFLGPGDRSAAIKQGLIVLYRSIFDVVRDFLHEEALGDDKVLAQYLKPDLVIIDDMGMKQLPKRSGEYLFEIIMRRYEIRSTMMTSNRPLEDWGKLIGDVPSATAILDRFLHHAEIVSITGRSYRLRNQTGPVTPPDTPPTFDEESKPAISPPGSKKPKREKKDDDPGSEGASAPCNS